jgi:hypothetical protein
MCNYYAVGFAILCASTPVQHVAAQRVNGGRSASAAVLRGTITAQGDTLPVAGADVWLISSDKHATSDARGAFELDSIPPGSVLLQIRHVGYDVRRDTLNLAPGETAVRRYALISRTNTLDTVRAVASQEQAVSPRLQAFEERRHTGDFGRFISDSVFRRSENSTLTNIITSHIPGLMLSHGILVSARKQCRGPALRGCPLGPDCYVSIYLDGALLFQAQMAEDTPAPDLNRVNVHDLAGAEFYANGASAPIGMHSNDDGCGTLWLWSREK